MVCSTNERPNGFRPPPSLSLRVLPLLHTRLPLELVFHILNLAGLFQRTWARRLETLASASVSNHLEFQRSGQTYLELPVRGPRLRKVLVSVTLGLGVGAVLDSVPGVKGSGMPMQPTGWVDAPSQRQSLSAPTILRASLVRPIPLSEQERETPVASGTAAKEDVIAYEPLDPPWGAERASFSVMLEEQSLVARAKKGDRLRINLMPHFRTRSGTVPTVKQVTVYLYFEW